MRSRSLRLRLIVGAGVGICLALILAGIAIDYLFASSLERQLRAELGFSLNRLAAVIDPNDIETSLAEPLDDPRYTTPFGGLYWQVSGIDLREPMRSRSLWDFDISVPLTDVEDGAEHYAIMPGPAGQSLSVLARLIQYPADEKSFIVVVAEDRAALAASTREFGRGLALALAILGAGLIAAAWLQVTLGLRPLKAVQEGIQSVRTGASARLAGDFPSEVEPLVVEVNDLLRLQETSIAFARSRASDLAHGLKTPLAVLATTASDLRDKGDEETARVVEELTDDMADKVDYQLRLSRLRIRTNTHVFTSSVEECIRRTIGVLQRTREGEDLAWETTIEPGLMVDLDTHDLIELLGVILENAAKWGRSTVTVGAGRQEAMVEIVVDDDGPGLPEERLSELGRRGHRLDETKSGAGLGLAIAQEIVGLNKGDLAFGRSPAGGLSVKVRLPASVLGEVAGPPEPGPAKPQVRKAADLPDHGNGSGTAPSGSKVEAGR